MSRPIISIVVPVYRVEPFLRRCINSVLAQSLQEFELILVDDGSTDSCGNICDDYLALDKRITVIHQCNRGLSASRNIGIDLVMNNDFCKWISFIDSDDWVHRDYLQVMLEMVDADGTRCAIGKSMEIDSDEYESDDSGFYQCVQTPDGLYTLDVSPISAWCKLYDIGLFQSVRYPEGKIYEDGPATSMVLFQCDRVSVTTQILYYHFYNRASIQHQPWTPKQLDEIESYEVRIKLFSAGNYENAYKKTIYRYINSLNRQLDRIEASKEYKSQYYDVVKTIQRGVLRHYGREIGINLISTPEYYYHVSPLLTKLISQARNALLK